MSTYHAHAESRWILSSYSEEFGEIFWKGMTLRKTYVGGKISALDPHAFDAWGITVNFSQRYWVVFHSTPGGRRGSNSHFETILGHFSDPQIR